MIDKDTLSTRHFVEWLLTRNFSKLLSDKTYIQLMYYSKFGKRLDLEHPLTFNEKLQWVKLNIHDPIYTTIVDKYKVKKYVSDLIGEEYIISTLGTWDSFEKIDFHELPDSFVLKCNHDSGGLVICHDKAEFDFEKAKSKITRCLKRNYYWNGREWPYKDVKPLVMAEEYLVDESETELKDYKFFCFDGKVHFFKIDFDRFIEHHANYYDLDMNQLEFGEVICPPQKTRIFDKPENFQKMVELAEILSNGFPFLRVDFYNISGKILFGELTLFPSSGVGPFIPESADLALGGKIKLPVDGE